MVFEHDYKNFPELSNNQINEFGFSSPHKQITEDFNAKVIKVIDGDTIRVRATLRDFEFPIRFLGIDAPELNEGGETAKDWLKNKIEGKNIRIMIDIKKRVGKWGRLLGKVLHNGIDIGDEELRLGLATTFENRNEGKIPNLNEILSLKKAGIK